MIEDDDKYIDMCNDISLESRCMSRQIGAVLVNENNDVISVGTNTPPGCVPHCSERYEKDPIVSKMLKKLKDVPDNYKEMCPRRVFNIPSGTGLEICPAVHAERACIISAANQGHSTHNTTLYMYECFPCPHCLIEMIDAGIAHIVLKSLNFYDIYSQFIFNSCSSIDVRLFNSTKIYNTL